MGKSASSAELWLWDGASEFEGIFVKLEEAAFTARVRAAKRSGSGVGKRVASSMDLNRIFTSRRFLAHFQGSLQGPLLEAQIESVQVSSDGDYDYLLAGRFTKLEEKQLEVLRKMSMENAAILLQRQTG